ncbi:MAG: hypothetical protein M3186_18050 [Actinomycetota bacterium]|nr:hypothetical protein [Actinomycetota bacterium]
MTTHSAPTEAQKSDEPADAGLGVRLVAELVTSTLCGLYRVNDQFVRMNAALGDDGYIDVEVTRVCFNGDDATVRVLLYPTAPVPVVPQSGAAIRSGSKGAA